MNNDNLLNQLEELTDKKLKPIKEQLDHVDMTVEAVNAKVDSVNQSIGEKIASSQDHLMLKH